MTFMQKIRYFSVVLLYLCANVLLVYNLWNLVVNKRDFLLEQSKLRVERKRVISVKRKKILDRNGEVLAMSLPKILKIKGNEETSKTNDSNMHI